MLPIDGFVIDAALDPGPKGDRVSLLQIKQFCEEIQLMGKGYRGTYEDIKQRTPLILHVDGHHYVTVSKIIEDGALVVDPAIGRQYWKKEELLKRWTSNVYFCIEK